MKMTVAEAEERKAYCGRCKYWRLYNEGECEEHEERHAFKGYSREECATIPAGRNSPPCVLGLCEIRKVSNFADEMYAGNYGEPDDCDDWEEYEEDTE